MRVIQKHGFGSYTWCIDACEVSTDLMWQSRPSLLGILGDLFDHAIRGFSADDVVRFLGLKRLPVTGEVETRDARRPEGRRIKHRIRRNWLKLYDRWSVLRIETVINIPADFRVPCVTEDKRGRRHRELKRMGKNIHNLWRYVQIGEACDRRYLEALASVTPTGDTIARLDTLCRPRIVDGCHYPRLNPVARSDADLFAAVLAGGYVLSGMRNRDLQQHLWERPAADAGELRRRSQRTNRLIRKLRGHGLLSKVPGRRRYRVTLLGRQLMAAALHYRQRSFPAAAAA